MFLGRVGSVWHFKQQYSSSWRDGEFCSVVLARVYMRALFAFASSKLCGTCIRSACFETQVHMCIVCSTPLLTNSTCLLFMDAAFSKPRWCCTHG